MEKPAESTNFFRGLTNAFGLAPQSYLVFDVETTGLDTNSDLVTQIGYCKVVEGVSVSCGDVILDWTKERGVDSVWFESRLRNCEREMNARGKTCQITFDRVIAEGQRPVEVLEGFLALLKETVAEGGHLLAHNAWGFDIPMLERHFRQFLNTPFRFPPELVWDTGMIEKGRQLAILPAHEMTMHQYYNQIRGRRIAGVMWSLDKHCAQTYEIVEKHGVDLASAHDAGFDCMLCHLVFAEQRKLMEQAVQE